MWLCAEPAQRDEGSHRSNDSPTQHSNRSSWTGWTVDKCYSHCSHNVGHAKHYAEQRKFIDPIERQGGGTGGNERYDKFYHLPHTLCRADMVFHEHVWHVQGPDVDSGCGAQLSLGRPALTLFLATGSLRAPTASGSLGFFSIRFTVDGVSYGDPRYGQRSINANGATTAVIPWIAWAVSHSLNLSAGSHNVSVDGYVNADNPGCLCLDDDAVSYNSTKCQLVVKT
jgi:hypothetical protein